MEGLSNAVPIRTKKGQNNENRMEQILQSHIVVPKYLRLDNFETFFEARENALLDRIEQAMGKPIARVAVPQDFDTVEEELEIEE